MPTLKITIKMDNAAFDPWMGNEVARILRGLAGGYEERHRLLGFRGTPRERVVLRDLNGNTVGEAKVTR
jgi:hypothetical protein